ncbi:MAG: ABC transporter permease subunit [Clostridiales bacterium]|nr:ABC transporter permease subunit [Clostridiales bacterium]
MLGKLILGEIKKILRPKSLITIGVLFVIFFILFAVFYNINWDSLLDSIATETEGEVGELIEILEGEIDFLVDVDKTNVDSYISFYQSEYQRALEQENGLDYYYKGVVTILRYVKANDLFGQDIKIAGQPTIKASAENFAMTYFSTVLAILYIYAIVVMAGLYADEYKNGTIKLVMLRPVTPTSVILAKIIAMFIVLLSLLGITTLIGFLYGLAAFGSVGMTKVLVLFNARHIWRMSYSGYVFLTMALSAISLLSYGMLSFSLGTVLKRKTWAILLGLVAMLSIIASILSFLGIDRFMFSKISNLSDYFTLNYGAPYKASFFIAMPMLIVYNALMYFAVFFITNKRDIV